MCFPVPVVGGLKDHLAFLREANLGRNHSEETKDKMRATALGRQFSNETNETTSYISVTCAADAIGCSRKTIMSRIRSNSLTPINLLLKDLNKVTHTHFVGSPALSKAMRHTQRIA